MDLAEHEQSAWQAVRRLRKLGGCFVVVPTVAHELECLAGDYTDTEKQHYADEIVANLGDDRLSDFNFDDQLEGQQEHIEQAARRLRREQLLPFEEWHDTVIICEAAMLGCKYLLTDDTHLLGVPQPRLTAVLRQMGLPAPRIISYHSVLA